MKLLKKFRNLMLAVIPFSISLSIILLADTLLRTIMGYTVGVVIYIICIIVLLISFGVIVVTFLHLVFVRDESLPPVKIKLNQSGLRADNPVDAAFNQKAYFLVGKRLILHRFTLNISTHAGDIVLYSEENYLPLKGHWRIYTDDTKNKEILSIIGFQGNRIYSIGYDTLNVINSATNEKIGVIEPCRLLSYIIRPTWLFKDAAGKKIGVLKKDIYPFPAKYRVYVDNKQVCIFEKYFKVSRPQMYVNFSHNDDALIDKKLVLAAAIVLSTYR